MNKQRKPYTKPGIVFEDFRTSELRGTPEMVERIIASIAAASSEQKCPVEDAGFPCSVRGGN